LKEADALAAPLTPCPLTPCPQSGGALGGMRV
jgi:hypothetical protein